MQDSQKIIQFLESLLRNVNDIKYEADHENALLMSKLNSLYGKIEGARLALEWTQKEKK